MMTALLVSAAKAIGAVETIASAVAFSKWSNMGILEKLCLEFCSLEYTALCDEAGGRYWGMNGL